MIRIIIIIIIVKKGFTLTKEITIKRMTLNSNTIGGEAIVSLTF